MIEADHHGQPLVMRDVTTGDIDRLTAALGTFSMGLIVTYVKNRDNIPYEVQAEFDAVIRDWNSICDELVVWEQGKQEAVAA